MICPCFLLEDKKVHFFSNYNSDAHSPNKNLETVGKYKEGNKNYPQFHAPDLSLLLFGCISWATSYSQNSKVWLWGRVTPLSRPHRCWGWGEHWSHWVPAITGVLELAPHVKEIGFQDLVLTTCRKQDQEPHGGQNWPLFFLFPQQGARQPRPDFGHFLSLGLNVI